MNQGHSSPFQERPGLILKGIPLSLSLTKMQKSEHALCCQALRAQTERYNLNTRQSLTQHGGEHPRKYGRAPHPRCTSWRWASAWPPEHTGVPLVTVHSVNNPIMGPSSKQAQPSVAKGINF